MAKAQPALLTPDDVKTLITDTLTDLLITALLAKRIPVPRPVVRVAVARAVDGVANVDPDVVVWYAVNTLARNPLVKAAEYVLGADFREEMSRKLKRSVPLLHHDAQSDTDACEVGCPESGDTIVLEDGDGFYTCPDCDQKIEVDERIGYHPFLVECASTGNEFWVKAEEGQYDCPECSLPVSVEDDEAVHAPVARSRPVRKYRRPRPRRVSRPPARK